MKHRRDSHPPEANVLCLSLKGLFFILSVLNCLFQRFELYVYAVKTGSIGIPVFVGVYMINVPAVNVCNEFMHDNNWLKLVQEAGHEPAGSPIVY